ncbi:MAG: TauD/TfdA family dioxygenase [Caldimonas sp.]
MSDTMTTENFRIEPSSSPLGNQVTGLDISQGVAPATFERLKAAFNDKSVLVFRDQKLKPEQQIAFSRGFGDLERHVVERYLLPGHPEIFRVSNIVENGQRIGGSGEFWHSDLSYVAEPSRGSLLYAIEVPTRDGVVLGDTEFASTASAYDALSAEMKKRLSGLRAVHRFGDIYAKIAARQGTTQQLSSEQKGKTPDVVHPVVIRHPFSGRLGLFVNEGFTVNIVGMPAAESDALLAELYAHSRRPEFVYRHRWQLGDLIMWDNWGTVHRATGGYTADERRLMHRTTLTSPMPFAALAAT